MPELPDITIYLESLQSRVVGQELEKILLKNPFLLRTAEPPLQSCEGRKVVALRRLGKRIAFQLEGDLWLVLHLMIAGRLHWYAKPHRGKVRSPLLQMEFPNGTLTLTEAGTKRRASLHVVSNEAGLDDHDRGGLEVLASDLSTFIARMTERNHTLKRALTDPTILSGIGNAYSDEVLHRARLSPLLQTRQLDTDKWQRLFDSVRTTVVEWTDKLRQDAANDFPERVTAFREGMATWPVWRTLSGLRYVHSTDSLCRK